MEKLRPGCGQPSDRGRLKNRTEPIITQCKKISTPSHIPVVRYIMCERPFSVIKDRVSVKEGSQHMT